MNRYLTTPIYYASGSPTLGHAYTTFVADCFKRYYLCRGDKVMLTTGTDEHGQKIERAAQEAGLPVAQFVEGISTEFSALWNALGLAVDRFERTTAGAHQEFVKDFWSRLAKTGDIYLGKYEGLYCVGCEQYFTEGDVCPVHRRPLEHFAEPSYFFRLSRYREWLIAHIEDHPDFIQPVERRNEMLSFLKSGELRDLSISRVSTKWGVPVPGDPDHVMYVWVDALQAYITAIDQEQVVSLEDPRVLDWWQQTTHFIGKDILTFHAVYWPALLRAAGYPLPRRLIANGWLTVEGRKISKSDPDTIIDPGAVAEEVGREGLKWYFLRAVSLGHDCDYRRAHLVEVINADLSNNIGNLFSRTTGLIGAQFPEGLSCTAPLTAADKLLLDAPRAACATIEEAFERGNPAEGAKALIALAGEVNGYVQQQAPWSLGDRDRKRTVLWVIWHLLRDITVLGAPYLPETMGRARDALGLSAQASWQELGCRRERVFARSSGAIYPRVGG